MVKPPVIVDEQAVRALEVEAWEILAEQTALTFQLPADHEIGVAAQLDTVGRYGQMCLRLIRPDTSMTGTRALFYDGLAMHEVPRGAVSRLMRLVPERSSTDASLAFLINNCQLSTFDIMKAALATRGTDLTVGHFLRDL